MDAGVRRFFSFENSKDYPASDIVARIAAKP